jgi:hypothetical protein
MMSRADFRRAPSGWAVAEDIQLLLSVASQKNYRSLICTALIIPEPGKSVPACWLR